MEVGAPLLVTDAVTALMESFAGTDSRTIAASVAFDESDAKVVLPTTGGRPLALVALTLTVIAERGVASLRRTTNATVPDGVAAAWAATTVTPAGGATVVGAATLGVATPGDTVGAAVAGLGLPAELQPASSPAAAKRSMAVVSSRRLN